MPNSWEKLPLPESPKDLLGIAIYLLPFVLKSTTLPDGELVTLTQNGGWHKIDKLLSPLYQVTDFALRRGWQSWISDLRQHADNLKVSHLTWPG